ncbi:hypothetical protein AB0L70_23175 [Kribbella sp. NPDC051952]|uniref:hypothetical protein n=1 Tax=Kribbella sp. NPDC051952 TaxID=3154851 RepID=UPI00342B3138
MKYLPLEFFGGVSLIIVIMIVAGRAVRRPGSPKGPMWQYIAGGFSLFVLAGVLYTFPPHSVVLPGLIMVLGAGLFTLGIAILGGGYFSFFGAAASGMAAVPFLMTPTPLALVHVGKTITCHIRGYRGHEVSEFTADCPDGHSYDFTKHGFHDFPGGEVPVIIDPHGVFKAEFVGEENVTVDTVGGVLGLIGAGGVIAAAVASRRRQHGQVKHVVKPPFSTGA